MTSLDNLRALCAAAPKDWPPCRDFYEAARTHMPLLLDYVEALEWERECYAYTAPRAVWRSIALFEFVATQEAAAAAVEAARRALELCRVVEPLERKG